MKQKPSESFRENLVGPCRDFLNNPGDVGRARTAAQAINGHVEWVFDYYRSMGEQHRLKGAKSADEFRAQHFTCCPDLKLVWHAADAAKHRVLRNPRHTFYAAATAQFMTGEGPVLWADDERPFTSIIENGLNYWSSWED